MTLTQGSVIGQANELAQAGIFKLTGAGAPTDGVTGVNFAGPGSQYVDSSTGNIYFNAGTIASPAWVIMMGGGTLRQLSGTISSADITGTGAGQLGHAQGVILVPAPGAGKMNELVSVLTNYDFAVAAYGGGGNVTVNWGAGGAALTGLVSAANSFGQASDNSDLFVPLSTAAIAMVVNASLNLVAAAAFTQPGTAAGVIRWVANYRVHSTGY